MEGDVQSDVDVGLMVLFIRCPSRKVVTDPWYCETSKMCKTDV